MATLKALVATLRQKCPKWSFSLCRIASFRQGSAEAQIEALKALGPTLRQKCPKWSFSLCRMASFRQGPAEAKIESSPGVDFEMQPDGALEEGLWAVGERG